ncbi:MAG: DinB family protein [Acidobacteria bacterium]|nr:DinB family protein [Acidobacteriota bacterium]
MQQKNLKDYRAGAVGSILDEYERSMAELRSVLANVSSEDYRRIVEGESEHCHSIGVIMDHVIRAGYGYSNYIRKALSLEASDAAEKKILQSEISAEIDKMMAYSNEIFENDNAITNEQLENVYFETRWGVTYNIDQLMEHAIVHVLRHRRQIEKFLLTFKEMEKSAQN